MDRQEGGDRADRVSTRAGERYEALIWLPPRLRLRYAQEVGIYLNKDSAPLLEPTQAYGSSQFATVGLPRAVVG